MISIIPMHRVAFTFQDPSRLPLSEVKGTGFSTLITSYKNLSSKTIRSIKKAGLHVWVEVGCFVGEDLWIKYSSSRPIQNGDPLEKLGPTGNPWYAGVIPTKEVVVDRLELIESILKNLNGVETVFLDFCRYPGRWEDGKGHAVAADNIRQDTHERQRTITSFIRLVRTLCDAKNVSLGIFLTPYDHAAYGQDLAKVSTLCQLSAPMLYHAICHRSVAWIDERLVFFKNSVTNDIVPVIQSIPEPNPLTPEEFTTSLRIAMHNTSGAMVLTYEAMDKAMKEAYRKQGPSPNGLPNC